MCKPKCLSLQIFVQFLLLHIFHIVCQFVVPCLSVEHIVRRQLLCNIPHYGTSTREKGGRKTFPRQNLINRVWFNTNSWLMLSASQPKNLSEVSALVFSSRRLTRPPGCFHLRSTRCPPAGSVAGCWTRPPSSLNIQPGWPVPSSRPPQPRLLPDRSKSPRSAWRPPHPSTWSAPHSSSLDRGRRSRNDW